MNLNRNCSIKRSPQRGRSGLVQSLALGPETHSTFRVGRVCSPVQLIVQQTPMSEVVVQAVPEHPGPLAIYLREIGTVPLLTLQEEVELADRIQQGDAAARERMIRANLRLVVKIARDYETFGLPLLDLISEGNIGLMKAADRFDPARGVKFSTYAAWWIKQSIKRALANQSKTIRLPVHLVARLSHVRRTAHRLHEILGRDPSNEEIAQEMKLPVKKVAQLRQAAVAPSSLEAPLHGDDTHSTLGETVPDESASMANDELVTKNQIEALTEVFKHLDKREAAILIRRFGLDGADEKTLEEIGAQMGVTRERIRQLQNLALQKLRQLIEGLDRLPLAA